MKDICPVIRIHLCGAFRVETGDGRDVSPKSAKACGLLALLAHSPRGQRTRVWLQDKLWSDRDREQGAASLRQALCRIRHDLGHCAGVVIATRGQVMLDLDRVEVVGPASDRAGPEFLEGIDIRDAEFEAWLRAERATSTAPPGGAGPAASPPNRDQAVFLVAVTALAGPERLFEDLFIDGLQASVSQTLIIDVYRRAPDPDVPDPVTVSVQAFAAGGQDFGLRVSVEKGARRRALWSGWRTAPVQGGPPVDHAEILVLIDEVTEALGRATWQGEVPAGPEFQRHVRRPDLGGDQTP